MKKLPIELPGGRIFQAETEKLTKVLGTLKVYKEAKGTGEN